MNVLNSSGQILKVNANRSDLIPNESPFNSSNFHENIVNSPHIQYSTERENKDVPIETQQMDFDFIDKLNNGIFTYDEVIYDNTRKDKPELEDSPNGKRHPRDQNISMAALRKAKYKCEYDCSHQTFNRKAPPFVSYTEPHHLIPFKAYHDFDSSLDVMQNICSLCSTCHNCLHYGNEDERDAILVKLYSDRKRLLTIMGLDVSLHNLKKYY